MKQINIVVGNQTTISSRRPSTEVTTVRRGSSHSWGGKSKVEDSDIQDGRLSVFIHKREEQSSHEVIQPLLRWVLFLTTFTVFWRHLFLDHSFVFLYLTCVLFIITAFTVL